jgi:bifunctional pyridoxal-dependent enzyme with beta-cystathionase and maltose regulon repressor activities
MHRSVRRAAVAAVILLAPPAPAAAAWTKTSLGKIATFCSVAVDADGHPHISYLDPWKSNA